MKFAQSMKYGMAVVGLGASLLFAGATYAQESAPDIFDVNPGNNAQAGVSAPAADDAVQVVASPSGNQTGMQKVQSASLVQSSLAGSLNVTDLVIAVCLAGCLLMFGLYSLMMADLKREERQKRNSSKSPAANRRMRPTVPHTAG